MKTEVVNSYNELSRKAKDFVIHEIENTRNLLLCAATGNSPTGTYQLLTEEFQHQPELFSSLRVIKLDEWGGIPLDQPGTCETYLQKNLIQPLQLPESRYIRFNSNPENPLEECSSIQELSLIHI